MHAVIRAAAALAAAVSTVPLLAAPAASQEAASPERGRNAVTVLAGRQTRNDLIDATFQIEGFNYFDTYFAGVAVSREVARRGGWGVEVEGGAGVQWGDFYGEPNDAGHAWAATYFRYDRFPWREVVRTSAGVSVGASYVTSSTAFERETGTGNPQPRLQHYFSPELAFARPGAPNLELVLRVHHRSGMYGLICEDCGSNIGTLGVRGRF